ncbi:hypothetical protein F3Y22_tig00014370pilonHSYRG00126 [Hibiscus syriacus]|uniref:Uncharacterized protein n=1 Tax=Hibiscus syriacus TaxID=106335 RepID=A0A6A3C3H5_HIBSY|nr:hypothetical protein F3Y22_tig00014370pilonHSYRG00126 [Hibiscus syriacus]
MGEDTGNGISADARSAGELLSYAKKLVPMALVKAREVKGFPGRLKMIISKLEQITVAEDGYRIEQNRN